MPELITLISGAAVVTAAATVQAITGFGFALVAIPFLVLIFDPKMAVGVSIIVSFCSLLILLLKVKRDTQWSMVKTLFGGALLGLPVGVAVFYTLELQVLKILISVAVIILSILLALKVNFKIDGKSKRWQLGTGSISGILTGSLGIPGPPIILFLSNLDLPKEKFRATIVAYFVLIYPSSFIALFTTGALPTNIFLTSLSLVPFAFLGNFFGRLIFEMVPANKFKKVVLALLILVSSYSIITSI